MLLQAEEGEGSCLEDTSARRRQQQLVGAMEAAILMWDGSTRLAPPLFRARELAQ